MMNPFEISSSIFMLICSIFGVICTLIFIFIVLIVRPCQTITRLLLFNSIIAGFIANIVYTCQSVYQLVSNEKDPLCEFRGFLLTSTCGLLYHTFCIQALYRLSVTWPLEKQIFTSKKIVLTIVIIQWLMSMTFSLPILLTHRYIYQMDSRICIIPFTDKFGLLYSAAWIYLVPILIIIGIYIRVIFYIKQHSFPTILRRNLFEQQPELRAFRLIIILIFILFLMGFPYVFLFCLIQIGLISTPPYADRICFMFISFGQGFNMLFCLMKTNDIRRYLANKMKKFRRRRRKRRVQCVSVIERPVPNVPINI